MTAALLGLVLAPLAAALVVAALREPMGVVLPLFALLLPFGGRLSLGPSPFLSLSSMVGLLLVAALALQLMTTRGRSVRVPRDVPVWLLFLGTATATALWTVAMGLTLRGIAVLASLVALYVLTTLVAVDRRAVRRTENALILGAVLSVFYGLFQLLVLGGFPSKANGEPSPTGRFGDDLLDANLQAIALLLPIAIALNRTVRAGRRGERWLNGVALVLLFTGVLMTGSRGGLVGLAATVLASVLDNSGSARRRILVLTLVGAASAALVWVYHPANIAARTVESATSSSGRADIWRVGLTACTHHCDSGSGWGTFPRVYADTQASVPGARVLVGRGSYQAHNIWLLVAIEAGVLGALLLTCGLALVAREAADISPPRRAPPISALAGLVAGVFFLSSLEFKFFWMVLIYVAMTRSLEASAASPVAGRPARERSAGGPSAAGGRRRE